MSVRRSPDGSCRFVRDHELLEQPNIVYSLTVLPDDTYTIMAMDLANGMRPGGGTSLRTIEVEVTADHTTEVEITFGTGRTVRGTIAGVPEGGMNMLVLRVVILEHVVVDWNACEGKEMFFVEDRQQQIVLTICYVFKQKLEETDLRLRLVA